jgi:NDP-sugar pyrophosphorylase family protein
MSNNSLCILAAGRGSRLGAFTNAVNKALLPVADKAVISHIIEKMPLDSEIIVALGYQGNKVKQYCEIAHPDRKFTFVNVDNYDGPGSGPGYSMHCCREHLQRPFYFCTVDCIVAEPFIPLRYDWIGVSTTTEPENFSTVQLDTDHESYDDSFGLITKFVNKKSDGFDLAFIGLAGIYSYQHFWKQLDTKSNAKEAELVSAFYNCTDYPKGVYAHHMTWLDTGTIENYERTKRYFEGNKSFNFDKVGEFTYVVNNRVIKYFDDPKRISMRVNRVKKMKGVPQIVAETANFFAYNFEPGRTLYTELADDCCDIDPKELWNWFKSVLWEPIDVKNFNESCLKFYRDKTLERFGQYKKKKGIEKDSECFVNGVWCQSMESYLEKVDWKTLSCGIPVVFHGDLQFDNVIRKDDGSFMLLDWRDCFADQPLVGDLYYDYAKLNGGLILPYNIIKDGAFIFYKNDKSVVFNYNVSETLKNFRKCFCNFYPDILKVELLTSLIYLNMSPLHEAPFDEVERLQ